MSGRPFRKIRKVYERMLLAARGGGPPLLHLELQAALRTEAIRTDFVLVRPDGHVAWRGDSIPADVTSLLDAVVGLQAVPPAEHGEHKCQA